MSYNEDIIPEIFKTTEKLIGYKKAKILKRSNWSPKYQTIQVLVVLEIPKGSWIFQSDDPKRRTSKAKVLRIEYLYDHTLKLKNKMAFTTPPRGGNNYKRFKYVPGEIVKPKEKFSMNLEQCASGIHFFLKRREAENFPYPW